MWWFLEKWLAFQKNFDLVQISLLREISATEREGREGHMISAYSTFPYPMVKESEIFSGEASGAIQPSVLVHVPSEYIQSIE